MREILNPLQQRLFLYGFAYVQLDPFHPIDENTWRIPGLQALIEPSCFHGWCGVLGRCRTFSNDTLHPVISPSLRGLTRLRKRFPRRPLILCQTAYDPVIPPARLRSLVQGKYRVTNLLKRDDPLQPLYWIGSRPRPKGAEVLAWRGVQRHPYERLRMRLARERPQSHFWFQEDGRLLEQPSLFDRHPPKEPDASFRACLDRFEELFRKRFSSFRGSAYLFSKHRAKLAWIKRDCLRLMGRRISCWSFPAMPDPQDPLTHFILIRDHQIRLTRLERNLPCFHLDGGDRRLRFRSYRVAERPDPRWVVESQPRTLAYHRVQGRELVFWLTSGGWQSQACTATGATRRDRLFAQNLEMLGL